MPPIPPQGVLLRQRRTFAKCQKPFLPSSCLSPPLLSLPSLSLPSAPLPSPPLCSCSLCTQNLFFFIFFFFHPCSSCTIHWMYNQLDDEKMNGEEPQRLKRRGEEPQRLKRRGRTTFSVFEALLFSFRRYPLPMLDM
jgi:hypothetical protein